MAFTKDSFSRFYHNALFRLHFIGLKDKNKTSIFLLTQMQKQAVSVKALKKIKKVLVSYDCNFICDPLFFLGWASVLGSTFICVP